MISMINLDLESYSEKYRLKLRNDRDSLKSAGQQGDRWIAQKQKLLDGKGWGDRTRVFPLFQGEDKALKMGQNIPDLFFKFVYGKISSKGLE